MSGVETGIVAALPEEVEEILSRLEELPSEDRGEGDVLPVLRRGVLGGQRVAVAVTGDGRRNALRGGRAFLDAVSMEHLLVVGVAGSLAKELAACTVLWGRVVWRKGEGVVSRPSDPSTEGVSSVVPRSGVVATVDRILDTPDAKRAVATEIGRDGLDGEPAVADLESAFYVALAGERELPCSVLRAVSDELDESLPSFLNQCRDEGGAVERSKVVRRLFGRPTEVSVLLKLRRRVRCCADRLADIVERLLREGLV